MLLLALPETALADPEILLDGSEAATAQILKQEFGHDSRQTGGTFFLENYFTTQGQPGAGLRLEAVLAGQSLGQSELTVRYSSTLVPAASRLEGSLPALQMVVQLQKSELLVHGLAVRFSENKDLDELGVSGKDLLIPIGVYEALPEALDVAQAIDAGAKNLDGSFSTLVKGRLTGTCGPEFAGVSSAEACGDAALDCGFESLVDASVVTVTCARRHFNPAQALGAAQRIPGCLITAAQDDGLARRIETFIACIGSATLPPAGPPGFAACMSLGLYGPFSRLLDCELCGLDCRCGGFGDCPESQELEIFGRANGLCPGEQVALKAICKGSDWSHESSTMLYKGDQGGAWQPFIFPQSAPCYAHDPVVGGAGYQTRAIAYLLEGKVQMQPGFEPTPEVDRPCTPPLIGEDIDPTTLFRAAFNCYPSGPCPEDDTEPPTTHPIFAKLKKVDPLNLGRPWTVSAHVGGQNSTGIPPEGIPLAPNVDKLLIPAAPLGSSFSITATANMPDVECSVNPASGAVSGAVHALVTCVEKQGLTQTPYGIANLPALDFPGEVEDLVPQICVSEQQSTTQPRLCPNPFMCLQPLPPLPQVPCYCDETVVLSTYRCNTDFFPSVLGGGHFTIEGPRLSATSPNVAQPGLPVFTAELDITDTDGLSTLLVFDGSQLLETIDLGAATTFSMVHEISAADLGSGEHRIQYVAFDSGGVPVAAVPGAPSGLYFLVTVEEDSSAGPPTLVVEYQGSTLDFDDGVWLGTTPEGQTGSTKQLTLTNSGGEPLDVEVTVTDPAVEIVQDVTTVAPGHEKPLRLRLTGSTAGTVDSFLYLNHNAPNHPVQEPFRVSLYGDVVPLTGCAADQTGPVVSLTTPEADAVVPQGPVDLLASATDDSGVANVIFLLDGSVLAEDPTLPYQAQWYATPGLYSFQVRAFDSCGNSSLSQPVPVLVTLSCDAPLDPPSVEIFAPAVGTRRPPGWTAIRATADSLAGIDSVEFFYRLTGSSIWQNLGIDVDISNGEWSRGRGWEEGDWQVQAEATDSCGNSAQSPIFPLTVAYDCSVPSPPSVDIFAPSDGATRPVGWTAIRATATSSNRVSSVEFFYRAAGSSTWQGLGVDSEISNGEWSRGRSWPAGDWQVKAEATDYCTSQMSDIVGFTAQ